MKKIKNISILFLIMLMTFNCQAAVFRIPPTITVTYEKK